MPSLPSTAYQLTLLVVLLLPGAVYQFARVRLRGPHPDDASATNRVLRALGASVLLVTGYIVIGGQPLVDLAVSTFGGRPPDDVEVRLIGVLALVLIFAAPTGSALIVYAAGQLRRRFAPRLFGLTYNPVPRAWDFAFSNIGPKYVRALLSDGRWIGGWYGENSFVSSFPEPREAFLEVAHEMGADGTFGPEVTDSGGVFIRCEDILLLEFLEPVSGVSSP